MLVFLALSACSIFTITVMSYIYMDDLNQSAIKVYGNLIKQAGESNQDALKNLTAAHMETISEDRVELYDLRFKEINGAIAEYKLFIEFVYQNSDAFAGHEVKHVTQTADGVLFERYMLAPGTEMTEEAAAQLRVLSNLVTVFRMGIGENDDMQNAYAGTELGVFYEYNTSSAYNPQYDHRARDWYINAMAEPDEIVWTSAYEDAIAVDRTIVVTCSTTFRDDTGRIVGVLATDVTVDNLAAKINEAQFGEYGYAFLMDETGSIIAHKDMHTPGFNSKPLEQANINPGYRAVLEKMLDGQSGFEEVTIDGKDKFISYRPLSSIEWSVGNVIDAGEVMAYAPEMEMQMADITNAAKEAFIKAILDMASRLFYVFLVLIAIVLIASIMLSNLITKPIKKLAADIKIVGEGNLNHVVAVTTGDEIKDFADAFNAMTLNIKEYIQNLAVQTREKERIASDLRIATDIQTDMLPKIIPLFSNRDDIHIAAMMQPAKEVGGDFYDFFFLDDEQTKIALVIADVSGKGVPAALFMVIAKVLIKNNKSLPADMVLSAVNNLLCADNNSSMFVTTYYSVLDILTGEYTYASAGHNPPILCRAGEKTADYLTLAKAPPLALFQNKKFSAQTIILEEGDTLMLYTDGITEAFNTASEMYGSERLLQSVLELAGEPVEDIVAGLHKAVKSFAGEEPQSDDITMLCCRYFGRY